jgi:hypothetical protein
MKRALALVALLLGRPPEVTAAGFFASGMASGFCPQGDSHYASGLAPVSAVGACTNLVGTAQFSASSSGLISSTGLISPFFGASGTIGFSDLAGHAGSEVQARAGYSDTVMLSAGEVLHLEWGIDGREVISGAGSLDGNYAGFRVLPGDTFTPVRASAVAGDTTLLSDDVVVDLHLPGGGAFTIQPELLVNMYTNVQSGDTRTYHSLVDLSNTVRLLAGEVRDAQGHAIPDAVVDSTLGIDYLHPAPEPGASSMTSVCAAVIAALHRHARASR